MFSSSTSIKRVTQKYRLSLAAQNPAANQQYSYHELIYSTEAKEDAGNDAITSEQILVKYNCGFNVPKALFESLLPKYEHFSEAITTPDDYLDDRLVDCLFKELTRNIKFGPSMKCWFKQKPGYGPCFAFLSELNFDAKVGGEVNENLLARKMILDPKKSESKQAYLEPANVGFYYGPKGSRDKKRYPMEDPLTSEHRKKFDKNLNIELKFNLKEYNEETDCREVKRESCKIGEMPCASFLINIHIAESTSPSIETWEALEKAIAAEMPHVNSFLDICCQGHVFIDRPEDWKVPGLTESDTKKGFAPRWGNEATATPGPETAAVFAPVSRKSKYFNSQRSSADKKRMQQQGAHSAASSLDSSAASASTDSLKKYPNSMLPCRIKDRKQEQSVKQASVLQSVIKQAEDAAKAPESSPS